MVSKSGNWKMNDKIYIKPDKAGTKQQLRSRIALLEDEYARLTEERANVLADITKLRQKLNNLSKGE